MANLPVGARVNISPRALASSEPVAVARRRTACATANDHRSGKTTATRVSKPSTRRAPSAPDSPPRDGRKKSHVPSQICARAPREMARRAVLAEAARALLSNSRRCVRCAPRPTIPRISRETSAPAFARHRPNPPTGAPSDPFASPLRDRARNQHSLDTRALVSWTAASDPTWTSPSVHALARRASERRTFRGYASETAARASSLERFLCFSASRPAWRAARPALDV